LEFLSEDGINGIHAEPLAGLEKVFRPLKLFADFKMRLPYIAMTFRWTGKDTLDVAYKFSPPPGIATDPIPAKEAFTVAVSEKQLVLTNDAGTKVVFRRPGLEGFAQLVDTVKGVRPSCAAFSPDSKTLAIGGSLPSPTAKNVQEAVVQLWDVPGRKERSSWWQSPRREVSKGDFAPFNYIEEVRFVQDGKVVVARDTLLGTTWWDVPAGKELLTVKERVILSADGRFAATLPAWRQPVPKAGVALRDGATGRELIGLAWERSEKLRALGFSPDGKLLAGLGEGFVTVLWDMGTRKPVAQLPPNQPPAHPDPSLEGQPFALAFSPDGKLLAEISKGLRLWDVASRTQVYQEDERPASLLFSPDGSLLRVPALYTVTRQGEKVTVEKRKDALRNLRGINPLAFSPDGTMLFARQQNQSGLQKVQVWQTKTWRPRTSFLGVNVALAPDGKHLAVLGGSDVNVVDLWRFTASVDD
jgi:WD40 repeat protein